MSYTLPQSTDFRTLPPRSGAALGIHAKTSSTASQCGRTSDDFELSVSRRFSLQAAARQLLPNERVGACLRYRIPSDEHAVTVFSQPAHNSASFGGLQTCGSVWHCPVCSARIAERRRAELSGAVSTWLAGSGVRRVLLVTFTLQHDLGDGLRSVVALLKKAYERFRGGRWWTNFLESSSYAGSVRSLEVTHGGSGWHPHLHVLFFFESDVNIVQLEDSFKRRWSALVERLGGFASYDHGLDVRFSDKDIADYVAKFGKEPRWSAADELTKANRKRGRIGGRSPLQLLSDYADGDTVAGRLWQIYALVFRGERQLYWSNGFRSRLGLDDEKTDEQLASEQDALGVAVCSFDDHAWRAVVGNDARAEILAAAAKSPDVLRALLRSLGINRGVRWLLDVPDLDPCPDLDLAPAIVQLELDSC